MYVYAHYLSSSFQHNTSLLLILSNSLSFLYHIYTPSSFFIRLNMNQQRTYHTFSLPKAHRIDGGLLTASVPNLAPYAVKYSHLKLKGLRQNPGAFSSTVASEQGLSDEEKLARISREDRTIFVVEEEKQGGDDNVEGEGVWAGQVVLVGPMTRQEYLAPFGEMRSEAGDASELDRGDDAAQRKFWHLTALYVDVDHRSRGLANMLCDAAYSYIRQHKDETLAKAGRQGGQNDGEAKAAESEAKSTHTLRIIIKPDNLVVVKMYERMGFHIMEDRRATLAEAIRCSGEEALPAKYEQNPQYTTRGGLIMTKKL